MNDGSANGGLTPHRWNNKVAKAPIVTLLWRYCEADERGDEKKWKRKPKGLEFLISIWRRAHGIYAERLSSDQRPGA